MLLLNKTLTSSLFVYFILFYFTLSYFRELTSVLPAHEEGRLSRTQAFDCGHGYAQEEHATKKEREQRAILAK